MNRTYTNAEFVKIFLAAKSKDEVAEKLGISTWTVIRVAQKMRKAGVHLPTFGRGGGINTSEPIDAAALNKLIRKEKSK